MRKLLVIASLLAMTTAASAEDWRHERHRPAPHYEHRHGGWVGPGVLLGIGAAAAIGTIFYYEGRRCWNEMAGYDEYGNKLVRRVCE